MDPSINCRPLYVWMCAWIWFDCLCSSGASLDCYRGNSQKCTWHQTKQITQLSPSLAFLCFLPQDLVIPIAIDVSLPDYVVKAEAYVDRMRVIWQPDDRFRIFFGGKISSKTHRKVKTGGQWYKGSVVELTAPQPKSWAPPAEKEAYDPWESVIVRWDKGYKTSEDTERVSPWEIEIDPEEERRRAEEAKRQQQAALRAQRARLSGRGATQDTDDDVAALEAEAAKYV